LWLPKVLGGDAGLLLGIALVNGACCVAFASGHRRNCFLVLLSSYLISAAVCLYLRETTRLPQRVAFNIPVFLNSICLYWAALLFPRTAVSMSLKRFTVGSESLFFKTRAYVGQLVAIVTVLLYGFFAFQLSRSLYRANAFNQGLQTVSRQICEPIRALSPAGRRAILIALPYDSRLEQALFFHHDEDQLPFSLVPYGWLAHSPLFHEILSRHGLYPYSLSLLDR